MSVYVIAEMGLNFMGDMDLAKKMIEAAHFCGVNAVKSQKRDINFLYTEEELNRPYENANSFGKTYGEHRKVLELTIEQHAELKSHAEERGMDYFCSAWEKNSAKQLIDMGCGIIKIPSACITLDSLMQTVNKENLWVIMSTGMSTCEEINHAVYMIDKVKRRSILHCTSAYPCRFEDLNLACIQDLKAFYSRLNNTDIGYSGHNRGIAVDIAAVAMGATIIERHFTLDRTWKGTDQAASLEPQGLQKLVRDIRATEQAIGNRGIRVLECEKSAREKLRPKADKGL